MTINKSEKFHGNSGFVISELVTGQDILTQNIGWIWRHDVQWMAHSQSNWFQLTE